MDFLDAMWGIVILTHITTFAKLKCKKKSTCNLLFVQCVYVFGRFLHVRLTHHERTFQKISTGRRALSLVVVCVTFAGLLLVYCLATAWLLLGYCLANGLLLGYCLTCLATASLLGYTAWILLGYCMATAWILLSLLGLLGLRGSLGLLG